MEKKTARIVKIIVFSCIFIAVFTVSVVNISLHKADNRFVFMFESLDDSDVHLEVRYVNTVPGEEDVCCYVKELMLGSVTNRYRPLFAKGTVVRSCFIRDDILYIDLSENALLQAGSSSETQRACSLLKENVKANFRQVADIIIFINGYEAYREDDALVVTAD